MRLAILIVAGLWLALTLSTGLLADEQVVPERALARTPKDYPEATLYARIPFLEPPRQWERLDIWVPKNPEQGRMPCVVDVFGGGYGEKVGGFIDDARTGIVSGVPHTAEVYPVIVSCMAEPTGKDIVPPSGDAVVIVVTVTNERARP